MPGRGKERNIKKLHNNKYIIRWELPLDPKTGKRPQRMKTVKGGLEQAKRELRKILVDIDRQVYVEPSKISVGQHLSEWFATYKVNLQAKPRSRYEDVIFKHLIPGLGHYKISQLTPTIIQGFYNGKLESGRLDGKEGGLDPNTVRFFHQILHKALDHAVVLMRISFNPSNGLVVPKTPEFGEKINPLNEKQVVRFREKAQGDRFYAVYECELGTGLRPGELFALTWSDIDLDRGKLTVNRALVVVRGVPVLKNLPKTKYSRRTISISPLVVSALRSHKIVQDKEKEKAGSLYQDNDLVFASEIGTFLNPGNVVKRHFKKILKSAGLPDIRFYDLRHTHATLMIKSGQDVKMVSRRLGHSDVAFTLRVYHHVLPGVEDEAVLKFDEVLTGKKNDPVIPEPIPVVNTIDLCDNFVINEPPRWVH